MKAVRFIFQIFIGLIFAFLTSAALSPLFAAFQSSAGATMAILAGVAVVVFVSIAPSIRRCFGRSFLMLGAAIFLLPLSALVLSGVAINETVDAAADADKGYAVLGGMLAGGLFTGFASFFGFIVGTVFLVIGLVLSLGGTREVVVIGRQ